MVDTIACSLQTAAGTTIDLPCNPQDITESLSPEDTTLPTSTGPPGAYCLRYQRHWVLSNVRITAANYNTLRDFITSTGIAETATYPIFKIYDTSFASQSSYDCVYGFRDMVLEVGGATIYRTGTVMVRARSKANHFTMVVDSGGGNAVTVYLDDAESIGQALAFMAPQTQTGDGESNVGGARAMQATLQGIVQESDLNKLQVVLDAETAVEMVGTLFDTSGSGAFTTELPAASTAYLVSLGVQGCVNGARFRVSLTLSHDRS